MMMMNKEDDEDSKRLLPEKAMTQTAGGGRSTVLTEGDLAYGVVMEREVEYTCCFQFMLILISIIAGIIQGYQIGVIAGTELFLGDQYSGAKKGEPEPSTPEREFFVSIFAIGAALGALFGGTLADWIGRKYMIIIAEFIISFGFVIIIISTSIGPALLGRFVSGLGQGIQSFCIPIYLNEVGTSSYNKIITAIYTLFTGSGMVIGLNLSLPLRHHWKWLYAIGIIPTLFLIFIMFFLPESQYHLINVGQDDDALEVLKRGLSDDDAELELMKLKYERRFF
jgi:MFS family permease